jgi:glycosyltransferase involved in cell wall biosynthesis
MSRHLHFYFSQWTNESRAWRSGALALQKGYASAVNYIGYKGVGLADEQPIDSFQSILRIGAEPAPPGSSRIRRALSLPWWWRACLREAHVVDASLVIAHGLAALPMAVLLARRHKLPLLYDAHELETERAGWSKSIRMMAKIVERRLIQKCDHVTLVNDSIRDWYLDAYPGIDCSVVRNVPNQSDSIGESTLRATLGIDSQAMVFAYCGALGKDRGLEEMIEAFRGLDENQNLVLIGYGYYKDALMDQARSLANVHFHEAVPQSELVSLLTGADVGIIVPRIEALSYRFMLPNKVFEYAAARLGIIVGEGPELERFAKEYPAARSADLTVESLRQSITAWTRDELQALQARVADYEPPSWQKEQPRLLAAFDRAIARGQNRHRLC